MGWQPLKNQYSNESFGHTGARYSGILKYFPHNSIVHNLGIRVYLTSGQVGPFKQVQ